MQEPQNIPAGGPEAAAVGSAMEKLTAIVTRRSKEREVAATAVKAFSDTVTALRGELASSRAREAALREEAETLRRGHALFLQNHRRLYQGFVSLLKSVEATCGHSMAMEQRIEAALLSSEIGNALGDPADVATARATAFLGATSNQNDTEKGTDHD